jgi:hypothetical protein
MWFPPNPVPQNRLLRRRPKKKKINTQATATMDKLVNEGTLQLVVNYIEDISSKLQSIDVNVVSNLLFLNHAFIVCNIVYNILDGLKRKGKIPEIPFLIGFVCVMATGLGGAALNSLLRAKPQIIFFNDAILVFFLCAWILTLYFPFGLIRRILSFPLFELVFFCCCCFLHHPFTFCGVSGFFWVFSAGFCVFC